MNNHPVKSLAVIAGLLLGAALVACSRPKMKPPGLTGVPPRPPAASVQPRTEKSIEHEPVEALPIPFASKKRRNLPDDEDPDEVEEPEVEEAVIE